jgi:chromosomal replication initiation ATPase DnaA
MLENRNQAIVSGILSLSFISLAGAVALPFDNKVEFRIGNRIESRPAWLVPPKAEFKGIERGYGGIKITLALLGAGGMWLAMLIARKEGELEPVRQRIKQYQNQAYEYDYAAESAYQMANTRMRYKKLSEADEVALEGQIKAAYCESLGIDAQQQQALLTGTATLESVANPSDKVEAATAPAIEPNPNLQISRQIAAKILNSLAGINTSIFLAGPTRCGKTHTLHKWLNEVTTRFPEGEIYVIAQKYEDFPGVPRSRIMIFDPLFPEESMRFLDEVYEKLQTRKSRPATEDTYRTRPIKLILEDWFATHQCLVQKRNAQLWEDKASKMGSIATVGGQYNVGYFICTQTFNLASSGVADSNIRLNLALVAQGLVRTTSNDEEQGSYGVIEQMLNNQRVIANKNDRDKLTSDLKQLIPVSMTEQTPVILSTIGNPVLGLMPKIEVNKSSVSEASNAQTSTLNNSSEAGQNLPAQDAGSTGKPCGTGEDGSKESERSDSSEADSRLLNSFLAEVLAESLPPVFSADFPLKKHERRVQLARLVIAENLGKEKTIFLLWGVTSGGRNHQRYADARAMLEKLINGA